MTRAITIAAQVPHAIPDRLDLHQRAIGDLRLGCKAFNNPQGSSPVLSRQFLSVKDVADLLKVAEVTVRQWIKNGDLRAIDLGREWRIAPADLERFLHRHANRPSESGDAHLPKLNRRGTTPSDLSD